MPETKTPPQVQKSKTSRKRRSKAPSQHTGWVVATDSEWDTSLQDPWISTAFASQEQGTTVFFRDDVPDAVRARLDKTAEELGVRVEYVRRTDETNLLTLTGAPADSRLLLYFSPKDVEYALGWTKFKAAIADQHVRQRNNISGHVGQTILKDLAGWAGKTSLLKFAQSLGIRMEQKKSMDLFKTRMFQGLLEHPEDFLRYAAEDVGVLLKLQEAFITLFRSVQVECLGMASSDLWTADDIPMTGGALVAKTFERWLYDRAGPHKDALKFCVRKLGILDQDHRCYKRFRWAYHNATKKYRSLADLRHGLETNQEDLTCFMHAAFLFSGLEGAGIRWWASRPITETTPYNALVQGGRCQNEHPYEYQLDYGLDVDIAGCYGSALRSLTFPVGLPSHWAWTPNEERITLGQWLDRYEEELVPGLWCATVTGKLDFEQDLLFSKLAKVSDIRRAGHGDREEDHDIDADFVMLRREVKNGVLTADVLRVLRNVATNGEWASIRQLQIVTAVAYLKRNQKSGVKEWCETILAHTGGFRSRQGNTSDDRSRTWYGVPLEEFVGKLVDRRQYYKQQARDETVTEEERTLAAGLDGVLKLLANTLYGTLASRFFTVGNTILANVITARARVGVWQLGKALDLRQSITDGGIYCPDQVCSFNDKRKPGLDTLSRMWTWNNSKHGRKHIPLGGLDWAADWEQLPPAATLDRVAEDHVRQFWTPYGLEFTFNLSHKVSNNFSRGAYWAKADYALQTPKGVVYAVRGKDKTKQSDLKQHPTFFLLDAILSGEDRFPEDLSYSKGGILRIGKYQLIQSSAGFDELKKLRPGDNLPEVSYVAQYNNTHFPVSTEEEYVGRRNRKKFNRGKPLPWFERFASRGISHVHHRMSEDNLRP